MKQINSSIHAYQSIVKSHILQFSEFEAANVHTKTSKAS